MSSMEKTFGVACGCTTGPDRLAHLELASGYLHSRSDLTQLLQFGRVSWHLIFLLLQLKHPLRDFVCPFLGNVFRLGEGEGLRVEPPDDSNAIISSSYSGNNFDEVRLE